MTGARRTNRLLAVFRRNLTTFEDADGFIESFACDEAVKPERK